MSSFFPPVDGLMFIVRLKALRKQLREIQHIENKRRRNIAQEKWKKKVAERTKHKEEIEKKKKEKLLETQM